MKKTWIKVKRGLITDPMHRNTLGIRIWLYLYMLDRANWDTGIIYEWRDQPEAADLEIPWKTLRDQRQKLDADGYITCELKGNKQQITIHNYTNPREYSDNVHNKSTENHVPKGNGKGDVKGSRKPRTLPYKSHNTSHTKRVKGRTPRPEKYTEGKFKDHIES